MVAVPPDTPVTTPDELTVATDTSPLTQVPPDGIAVSVDDCPWQTLVMPVIGGGAGYTFTWHTSVPEQPLASVTV